MKVYAFVCISALCFSGCATNGLWFSGPRGAQDKSFPPAGEIIEQGEISYLQNKTGLFTRKTIEEQRQEPKSPTDIYVQGNIQKDKFSFSSFFKDFLEGENSAGYEWEGFIRTETFELPLYMRIGVTRPKSSPDDENANTNKLYALEECTVGAASIEIPDIFNDETDFRAPYLFSRYTAAGGQSLHLYAVREPQWKAHGKNASDGNAVDAAYPKSSVRDLFSLGDQLYQIVDETGLVYADLSAASYTLYNTVPKDMITDVKCLMGMFTAWRALITDMENKTAL